MIPYPENERTLCLSPQKPEPKRWHQVAAWVMVWAAGLELAYIFAPLLVFLAVTILFALIVAGFSPLAGLGTDGNARYWIVRRK